MQDLFVTIFFFCDSFTFSSYYTAEFYLFFCFNSTGAVAAQAVNSVLSYVKEACTIWKDIFTLSCLTLIFTWRGEQNGSDLLASGWWKLQQPLVFMKFSTILVSTILKRLRSDCARCDGDGGKVTKATRQTETVLKGGGRGRGGIIDLIYDTHHLCTRFRINGVKAVSRFICGWGEGGGKINFGNRSNRGQVCLFYQNETTISSHGKWTVRVFSASFTCHEDIRGRYCNE